MNDIDLCLEVVSRSRQPLGLCHIRHVTVWETVRDRGLVPKVHR